MCLNCADLTAKHDGPPFIPAVGDLVLYTHRGSGIIDRPGLVFREDDDWFYVRIKGFSIEFPLHKDNRFHMVRKFDVTHPV